MATNKKLSMRDPSYNPKAKPTTSNDSSATLASAKSQLEAIQKNLNSSVASGQIKSGKTTPPIASQTGLAPNPAFTKPEYQNYTPYTPQTSGADAYYKSLMDSMKQSDEETKLQDQQGALDSELRNLNQGQGVMNRNIKDQPISMGFITGQQNAVEERYGLQRQDVGNRQQTLQQKLANLQSKRQSAIDVAKVGVDYGQSKDTMLNNANQQNYTNAQNINAYNAGLYQQNYQNMTQASQYADKFTQSQQGTQSQKGTQSSSPSVPQGGYDSSQGFDFMRAKTADLKTRAQSMFASSFATSLMTTLTDEQLRLFLNDFTETQNQSRQSLEPAGYLSQWKQAAGIGQKSSSRAGWNQ